MKKRNLIATNCPPGVECDGKSADDGDKPGKLPIWKYALAPVDSQKSFEPNRCQNLIV